MPIEVEDVAPAEEATKPSQENIPPAKEMERPKAKARGRSHGSKNRPKAQA